MKKLFLLFALTVISVCSAWALTPEELIGKWDSNNVRQEATPEMPMAVDFKASYTFKADGKADVKSDAQMTFEVAPKVYVDVFMAVSAKGEFTVAGDSITITPDPATVQVTFTEDDVRVRGMEDAAMAVQIQEQIFAMMSQQTDEMKKEFCEPDVLNDVLVTGKKMVCNIDGQIVTLKRKK